jgi:hypothetical protein
MEPEKTGGRGELDGDRERIDGGKENKYKI